MVVIIVIIVIIAIIATFNFLLMVTVLNATQWVTPEIVCYVKSNNPMMRNTSASTVGYMITQCNGGRAAPPIFSESLTLCT